MCKDVFAAYSSAKIIFKIIRVFPKLRSQMYCHVFMKQKYIIHTTKYLGCYLQLFVGLIVRENWFTAK